jgi:hypothetical protein
MCPSLKLVSDGDYCKTWISPSIDHGDFPFRFILKLEYLEEPGEEIVRDLGKYLVNVCAVSVLAAAKEIPSCCRSMGMSEEEYKNLPDEAQHEMLSEYGVRSILWEKTGNNQSSLLREARKELQQADFLFGFYMDRQQNTIGATGWDTIKGNLWPQPEPIEV